MAKHYFFFLIITALCLSFKVVHAQDVDDIISKHIKAHGGDEALSKIENIKFTGYFTGFSIRKPITVYKEKDGRFYSSHSLGKNDVLEGYNSKIYWTVDPWFDISFPRRMNNAEVFRLKQKAVLVTPFYKYKENGYIAELLGEENIEGVDVYKIKLTMAPGQEQTWYLSTETYLEYKMESLWADFAYPSPQYSFFDNFTEVDGVTLPFYVEHTFGQRYRVTEIENVEFNVEVDKSIFSPELSEPLKKLQPFEGDFDVKVEVLTRRGTWYNTDNTTSTIFFEYHNVLTQEIDYSTYFSIARRLSWTYHDQAKEYRMMLMNDFYGSFTVLTGNFTDTSMVFDNTKISYGEDAPKPDGYSKYEITEITDDGFVITIYGTRDLGLKWRPREKLTYRRRN